MKKIFAVVGHRNWGKTYTIRALFDRKNYEKKVNAKRIEMQGKTFGVKHMSNDDLRDRAGFENYLTSLERLIKTGQKREYDGLVLPLCPVIGSRMNSVSEVADLLKDYGKLYFFVLYESYDGRRITAEEISELENLGTVSVLKSDFVLEAHQRAEEFEKFIKNNI